MKLHGTHSLGKTIVTMSVIALGPIVMAQPATDVSANRFVYTEGSATDFDTGIGDHDSDEIASSLASGPFDESAQISLNDPNQVAGVEGFASQASDIYFVNPNLLHITGQLDIANQFLSLASNSDDLADVVVYSETGFSFRMTTDLPVRYDVSIDYAIDFDGMTGGPSDAFFAFTVFDVFDFVSGGAGGWDFDGEVAPGEHLVSFALLHTATDVLPHSDVFVDGTVNFEVTAHIVPTPASGVMAAALLVGLLLRHRRPHGVE